MASAQEANLDATARAAVLNNLGAVAHQLGRFLEAEKYYRESVRLLEAEGPAQEANLCRTLNNLGTLYAATGKYAKAEAQLWQALAIRRIVEGPDSPGVARIEGNLGQLFLERRNYAAAGHHLGLALVFWQSAADGPHPETGIVCSSLARLHYGRGEYAQAAGLAAHAISTLEAVPGAPHAARIDALLQAGKIAMKLRIFDGAAKRLSDALYIARNVFGDSHPQVAQVLLAQAQLKRHQNRKAEAKRLEKVAKTILADHRSHNLTGHTVDFGLLEK
jgi:tetratricopeptide (TPR) repeat protein